MTYKQKALRGISRAFFDSDLVATRMTLALAEFAWCIMLLWPGDTFERPTYFGMADIAGELWWAVVFGVSAIIQLSIVVFWLCNTRLAHWFGAWNGLLWLVTIAAMLDSVYPPPAAIGGEIALTMAAIWIGIRPMLLSAMRRKCGAYKKDNHVHA
jgi:hypothetical protein